MPSILIVDDAPAIVRMLHAAFRGAGYEVTTAPDGETAVALCLDKPFDAIVSDVNLPGMSGCDLARVVAERHPATRLLLISGYEVHCGDCPYSPRCALLRKPFNVRDLIETGRAQNQTGRNHRPGLSQAPPGVKCPPPRS